MRLFVLDTLYDIIMAMFTLQAQEAQIWFVFGLCVSCFIHDSVNF